MYELWMNSLKSEMPETTDRQTDRQRVLVPATALRGACITSSASRLILCGLPGRCRGCCEHVLSRQTCCGISLEGKLLQLAGSVYARAPFAWQTLQSCSHAVRVALESHDVVYAELQSGFGRFFLGQGSK